MEELTYDLADPSTFRQMVKIYDKIDKREMPPRSEPRPDRNVVRQALKSMKSGLLEANLVARKDQRVTLRRLTRLEYEYTLHDLLGIHDSLAGELPAENDSASFDTVAAEQRFSAMHATKFLEVADRAINSAIRLGKRPPIEKRYAGYLTSPWVQKWGDIPMQHGGQFTMMLDDAVALYYDLDWVLKTYRSGFYIGYPGMYKVQLEGYAHQATTPVTMTLTLANNTQGVMDLVGAIDLYPNEEPRTLELTTFLEPFDFFNPSVDDLDPQPNGRTVSGYDNVRAYRGEGVAIKSLSIEGPLYEMWPPKSTQQLLPGVEFVERKDQRYEGEESGLYEIKLSKKPIEHVSDIVARFAPLAFRRPLEEGELEAYTLLAEPAIAEGRDFVDVARVPLRAILSSPRFLTHAGTTGTLDDYALATRLSYFLWKSLPDEELFQLASEGKLSDPAVLEQQVDRLLDDKKSMRFVKDFLGQALRLREIAATTPDTRLYSEYDDLLHKSILEETELFFAELVKENLGLSNLIDSDFTFLNRRLAEHYGIPGVVGQEMRKVAIPEDSPRGGILTQASILKITANGTVTTPIKRGNFVVSNLLGDPSPPPPATVVVDEPDTRGSTTIRETLDRHRDEEVCATCHNHIDPGGFALESFDPIGAFRTKYKRNTSPDKWPDVDATGISEAGDVFADINEFKQLLLKQEDEVAYHYIAQLVVFATGGEIEFADREELKEIIELTSDTGNPVRTIIHNIVQSNLFRSK
jgi:hypothetical protein